VKKSKKIKEEEKEKGLLGGPPLRPRGVRGCRKRGIGVKKKEEI